MKTLICDSLPDYIVEKIAQLPGLELLDKNKDRLHDQITQEAEVVIVRSATKMNAELIDQCKKVKLIIRAGMGVDNIDVEAATRQGIAVMNTPAKNSNAAAELALALMFACCRNVAQAHASIHAGKWERNAFMGHELMGKTLALIGLGNVGKAVAKKALGLGMTVMAYDPYVSEQSMEKVGVNKCEFSDALKQADVVSLHLALTDDSKYLLGKKELLRMKKTAYLINCARGGLIDEAALNEVLSQGHLAGVGLDVFEHEPLSMDDPLLQHKNLLTVPHLGASTYEAQDNVGWAVIEQLKLYIEKDLVINGVNVPAILPESFMKLGKLLDLSEKMASMLSQTIRQSLLSMNIAFAGDLSKDDQQALKSSALVGALRPMCKDSVNFVNAGLEAQKRDIHCSSTAYEGPMDYTSWIKLELETTDHQKYSVQGALMGKQQLKIVSWNGYDLEIEPKGHMLIIENKDQPGNLGKWAQILGDDGINIEELCLSATKKESNLAVSIVRLGGHLKDDTLVRMSALDMVHSIARVYVA